MTDTAAKELLDRIAEIVRERDEARGRLAEALGVIGALAREIEALRRDTRRFNAMMNALHGAR